MELDRLLSSNLQKYLSLTVSGIQLVSVYFHRSFTVTFLLVDLMVFTDGILENWSIATSRCNISPDGFLTSTHNLVVVLDPAASAVVKVLRRLSRLGN